tara:strand:- start:33 stop:728 length:696 start_codon:yes stop_codon:yes gene_type:complete
MTETITPDTVCHEPERLARLRLEALLPYIPKSAKRVLDCTGELSGRGAVLKDHGVAEAIGLVDASAGTPEGNEGYDELIMGPLDFLPLPFEEESIDCILLTHVLERLRNPEAFLEPLLKCLTPGGIVVLTVPNMQYHKTVFMLAEGRWVYGDSGIMARKNLRFFTGYEVRWLLHRLGYTNVKFSCLVKDDERALPRDSEGYVRQGDVQAGPLADEHYIAWLTEYYLVLATR